MDEATLAAELLAEKFNTQAQTHTQLSHLQSPSQLSTEAAALPNVTYPQANTTVATTGPVEPSNEPVQAYAKLEGESFCYYVRYATLVCKRSMNVTWIMDTIRF